ncbi:hypothetical protein [uncultured Roseobacter sp.]|uniref:hypothetical protein n=1 Tax=uncultured Roseobacter sp. TaxID=114847 RepID=UPI00260A173B|nr:hypothetical protein [uncultured Roseobacter sp.]
MNVLGRVSNRIDIGCVLISNEADICAFVTRIRALRTETAHFNPASSTISIAAQHAPIFSIFQVGRCTQNPVCQR